MPCRLAKLQTFRVSWCLHLQANRCKKKQLQKFQRIVVPPSSESSIPSRRKYHISKVLATLEKVRLKNSSRRGLTTLVYNCLTQYYEERVLDKNTRNFLMSRKTCLIQNIIHIIAELQDVPLRGQIGTY